MTGGIPASCLSGTIVTYSYNSITYTNLKIIMSNTSALFSFLIDNGCQYSPNFGLGNNVDAAPF